MLPTDLAYDVVDSHVVDIELASDVALRSACFVECSDFAHGILCETRHAVTLAFRLASLGNLVGGVVGLGTEEPVEWVLAWRIVASVQDALPLRNGTVEQCPSEPGRQIWALPPSATQLPVRPRRRGLTCPRMARFAAARPIDLSFVSYCRVDTLSHCRHLHVGHGPGALIRRRGRSHQHSQKCEQL